MNRYDHANSNIVNFVYSKNTMFAGWGTTIFMHD